jgi:hypothetical protein
MGNPFEESFFWDGWRDFGQGEPRPMDVVTDPACKPQPLPPGLQQALCEFEAGLKKPWVFFTKRPAFVEPPFFSKPLIKAKCALQVAAGQTGTIFDRLIEDRQRVIVAMFGLDLAPLAPLMNGQLEFWFQRASAQGATGGTNVSQAEVVPLFDDQTPTTYGGSTPVRSGRTTVLPGSVENPFSLFQNGLQFGVRGRSRLQMLMENKSGVTVTIRGVLGFYQYWSAAPGGASEWSSGDLQL